MWTASWDLSPSHQLQVSSHAFKHMQCHQNGVSSMHAADVSCVRSTQLYAWTRLACVNANFACTLALHLSSIVILRLCQLCNRRPNCCLFFDMFSARVMDVHSYVRLCSSSVIAGVPKTMRFDTLYVRLLEVDFLQPHKRSLSLNLKTKCLHRSPAVNGSPGSTDNMSCQSRFCFQVQFGKATCIV